MRVHVVLVYHIALEAWVDAAERPWWAKAKHCCKLSAAISHALRRPQSQQHAELDALEVDVAAIVLWWESQGDCLVEEPSAVTAQRKGPSTTSAKTAAAVSAGADADGSAHSSNECLDVKEFAKGQRRIRHVATGEARQDKSRTGQIRQTTNADEGEELISQAGVWAAAQQRPRLQNARVWLREPAKEPLPLSAQLRVPKQR